MAFFLDDADEQDDADQAMTLTPVLQRSKGEIAPTPADGSVERIVDGMNVAFVEDAENDVNGDQRGENEDGFICQLI